MQKFQTNLRVLDKKLKERKKSGSSIRIPASKSSAKQHCRLEKEGKTDDFLFAVRAVQSVEKKMHYCYVM